MKTLLTTILLSMLSWIAFSQDCIPNYLTKSKYHILTVRSDTYAGAKTKAAEQIPNIGVMTKVSVKQTKVMTSNSFDTSSTLRKGVDVEIPMYRQFECRDEVNGDWLISILMPKEGVKYYPTDRYLKELTIPFMKKMCKGYEKFGYVSSLDRYFTLQAEKIIVFTLPHWYTNMYIVCGEMSYWDYNLNWKTHNMRQNFIAIDNGNIITDDLWLNLISDIKGTKDYGNIKTEVLTTNIIKR